MNLEEFEKVRGAASVAASNQARTLSIGGLGLVWLFAGDFFLERTNSKPSAWLAVAGTCLALCLLIDAAQLFTRWALLESAFNAAENQAQGRAREDDPPFENVGRRVSYWTVRMFIVKFASLGLGYCVLALYFALKFAR